jgi:isopenicillin-N N-acyltransferase-like protein
MTEATSEQRFREIFLSGNAIARGRAHGEQLRAQIEETLDYYRRLFGLGNTALREQAQDFAGIIEAFNPAYAREIEALAAAANIDPLFAFAMNSRSEILNNLDVPECTAVMNCEDALLAQNWDWSEALEPLVVMLAIEREDGHRLFTLTEPGIIGKIGMNSAGLGVCLNILKTDRALRGVPVHILLRAILDCGSMAQARALVDTTRVGKASHVLIGAANGECLGMEYAAQDSHALQPQAGVLVHTNHYLADVALNTMEAFPSTHERMLRATELLAADKSRAGVRAMLLDQSEAELSICRAYSPAATAGFGTVGTVFSVLMELEARTMHIRRGANPETPFYQVAF